MNERIVAQFLLRHGVDIVTLTIFYLNIFQCCNFWSGL